MTGVASQFEELITKQLQLLKESSPSSLGSRFSTVLRSRLLS